MDFESMRLACNRTDCLLDHNVTRNRISVPATITGWIPLQRLGCGPQRIGSHGIRDCGSTLIENVTAQRGVVVWVVAIAVTGLDLASSIVFVDEVSSIQADLDNAATPIGLKPDRKSVV